MDKYKVLKGIARDWPDRETTRHKPGEVVELEGWNIQALLDDAAIEKVKEKANDEHGQDKPKALPTVR